MKHNTVGNKGTINILSRVNNKTTMGKVQKQRKHCFIFLFLCSLCMSQKEERKI